MPKRKIYHVPALRPNQWVITGFGQKDWWNDIPRLHIEQMWDMRVRLEALGVPVEMRERSEWELPDPGYALAYAIEERNGEEHEYILWIKPIRKN